MLTNCVSPPRLGTVTPYSMVSEQGSRMKLSSVCHEAPLTSFLPSPSSSRSSLEMMLTSSHSGVAASCRRFTGVPKRAMASRNATGASFWPRMQSTRLSCSASISAVCVSAVARAEVDALDRERHVSAELLLLEHARWLSNAERGGQPAGTPRRRPAGRSAAGPGASGKARTWMPCWPSRCTKIARRRMARQAEQQRAAHDLEAGLRAAGRRAALCRLPDARASRCSQAPSCKRTPADHQRRRRTPPRARAPRAGARRVAAGDGEAQPHAGEAIGLAERAQHDARGRARSPARLISRGRKSMNDSSTTSRPVIVGEVGRREQAAGRVVGIDHHDDVGCPRARGPRAPRGRAAPSRAGAPRRSGRRSRRGSSAPAAAGAGSAPACPARRRCVRGSATP